DGIDVRETIRNEGAPLRYRGEYFRLSLMTPFFSPEPLDVGPGKPVLGQFRHLSPWQWCCYSSHHQ
ncbi:MAG: hypothetical protein P8077_04135, partial [Gammaproteobacteria bacterium]